MNFRRVPLLKVSGLPWKESSTGKGPTIEGERAALEDGSCRCHDGAVPLLKASGLPWKRSAFDRDVRGRRCPTIEGERAALEERKGRPVPLLKASGLPWKENKLVPCPPAEMVPLLKASGLPWKHWQACGGLPQLWSPTIEGEWAALEGGRLPSASTAITCSPTIEGEWAALEGSCTAVSAGKPVSVPLLKASGLPWKTSPPSLGRHTADVPLLKASGLPWKWAARFESSGCPPSPTIEGERAALEVGQ